MVGRTFRQTRRDNGDDTNRVIVTEDSAAEPTRIVQSESSDDTGKNRIQFEPETNAATISVTTDEPADDTGIDPESIPETTSEPRRRRRSDAGTQRGPRKARGSLAQTSNLEKMMLSTHLMAATFLKVPELRIDEQEAAMLTKSTTDLMKAYGVPDLTEKQLAVSQALMTVATVYGPRFVVIMNRKRNSRPKLVQPVIPFPATQAVQQTMSNAQQTPTPPANPTERPAFFGAAPQQPPEQYVSSRAFGADTSNGLDTISAS